MTHPLLPAHLDLWQQTIGWLPTDAQQQLFQRLYAEILAGNQHLNLTRITAPEDFWEKHLWDSLRGLKSWLSAEGNRPLPEQIIDVGTGAGFPGLPVAIALPQTTVTLLDSTQKKITFLKSLAQQLLLPKVQCLADRAETLGQQDEHRAKYDLALIRAVAGADICAEYCLPLLRLQGAAVLYRGKWTAAEATALKQGLILLGGELETVEAFRTPITQSERHCLVIRKVANTPLDYPRAIGIPRQKPLGGSHT